MSRDSEPSAGEGPADRAKRVAAERAAEMVEDGMRVGLGTGSTARHLIARLGERVAEGLRFTGAATSQATARLALEAGLQIAGLDRLERLDLTIDGADEIDPDLNLVKGGGGALLHEKIVAAASDRMVVIADASKLVPALGAFPLPVEVVPFGWRVTRSVLEEALSGLDVLGREVRLRAPDRGGAPFVTDGGNYCLDLHLGRIADPWRTALVLNAIPRGRGQRPLPRHVRYGSDRPRRRLGGAARRRCRHPGRPGPRRRARERLRGPLRPGASPAPRACPRGDAGSCAMRGPGARVGCGRVARCRGARRCGTTTTSS